MGNLAVLAGRNEHAEKVLEQVRAKRRELESQMGRRWNRQLSLQIDECLLEEDLLSQPIERTIV
jgi:hypothetical protein